MTTIHELITDLAEQLEDLLVDPRLAREVEAEPIGHRNALQAYAALRLSAGMFDARAERAPDGAHAATEVPATVRVFRVDAETSRRFHKAMPPPVVIDGVAKVVLSRLWRSSQTRAQLSPPVAGDRGVTLGGLDALLRGGLASEDRGVVEITEAGRAFGRELGWPAPAEFDRAREALASLGRAVYKPCGTLAPGLGHVRIGGEEEHNDGDRLRWRLGPAAPAEVPAVAPLDFPLTIDEEAARLAAVTGPCDGASFLALARALSSRMGQPISERTAKAVASVREALDLAHARTRGAAL